MAYRDLEQVTTGELLTRREQEVADLVARGFTNDQIAAKLVLTPGTVANHVAHILAKLGLQSRVQIAVRAAHQRGAREADEVMAVLNRLREVADADPRAALQHVADELAAVFSAEKVDVFLFDAEHDMLIALGTSQTPLGQLQRQLGLDRLPVSHGGRAAWVFQQWRPYCDGHVEDDSLELLGVRRDLRIRSVLATPLEITPEVRGILLVSSTEPECFGDAQLQLLQFVAYWVGLVAQNHLVHQNGSRANSA